MKPLPLTAWFPFRPQVVLGALETLSALAEDLGEDYMQPLLPDTVPYVTEALESSNEDIEDATRKLFVRMEEILGDNLRSYLAD